MAFPAKFAAPTPVQAGYLPPVLARALEGGTTLFHAPPGSLPTGQISTALSLRQAPSLWLRLGPEDQDPGVLLTTLIAAAGKLRPETGWSVLKQMRSRPGPVNGWATHFALLASEIKQVLAPDSAVVIEHLQHLLASGSTLALLSEYFLPLLAESTNCILVSHEPVRRDLLPLSVVQRGPQELNLDEQGALLLARMQYSDLTSRDILRLRDLTGGRQRLLSQALDACSIIGINYAHKMIDSARGEEDLLARLARALSTSLPEETIQQAFLALRLGYFRKAEGRMPVPDPSVQMLDNGWGRICCSWTEPLRSILPSHFALSPTLRSGAEDLLKLDDTAGAVSLYLDAGEIELAARTLSSIASAMLDLGQWQTLSGWLNRLPPKVIGDWPWLVYSRGELEAARRDIPAARRSFATASEAFRQNRNPAGLYQSLLTESALAFWQGDTALALNLAINAQTEARNAGQLLYQAYASWQIGCQYAAQSLFDTAMRNFQEVERIAMSTADEPLTQLARQAVDLIQNEQDLRYQEDALRRAAQTTEQALKNTTAGLQKLVSSPAGNLSSFLLDRGWSQMPISLKLQPVSAETEPAPAAGSSGLWQMLLGILGFRAPAQEPPIQAPPLREEPVQPVSEYLPVPAVTSIPSTGTVEVTAQLIPETKPIDTPREERPDQGKQRINAWMLGDFRVTINDQPVTGWSGGRGRAVFQYLLTYRQRPRSRETIMDIFWQDAAQESARNSLNVALHSLRGSLRSRSSTSVILFEEGAYRINPEFNLWVDVDEFEQYAKIGQEAEQSGKLSAAIEACEKAILLYQGDFLAEDPYEEWAILPRERLKIVYMDILDRLSRTYLQQGQYPASILHSLRLLERDRCREDAHCRLMRCYARQGEYSLAIRQYQACMEALKADLDISPSPSTIQLYERIRNRDAV